jgi:ABC-type glycerol-3-phosphate transport system permease component
MNAVNVVWFFALIVLVPILPQAVGFISFLLLKKHHDLVAHIVGVIIPPLSSFYLFLFFLPPTLSSSLGKEAILLFGASFLHLFFSLMIQLAVHNRHKFSVGKLP